jgi:thiol-activated cytolysin
MFDGASDQGLKGLREYIAAGSTYRRDNPGLPVAYTVVFLKDNQFARIGSTAEYTETECVRYRNGFVRFAHEGWYVARFSVSWTEPDGAGNYTVQKSWASGDQTRGYTTSVSLPGDARNVQLFAEAATGLVWSPWGEIFKVMLAGPDNKTYHATGTTLDRSYNVTAG